MHMDQRKKDSIEMDFFTEYGDANRYKIQEVIGKGSYGVVCSALDVYTGEKVAIKKINGIFEHISDAARILREIKLLRLLRHPDIVDIKHIILPPSKRAFRDIYVVFELMESDLHQVLKANDDLTKEHHQFFIYQLLRALKYMHTANVYHRDLKPKNILANANCKLKICDFGLARVAFHDTPLTVIWTDYVATRWYRAPELCGSFYSRYTPAIDIWSVGCIFAEILTGKPLFPGKNVVHQLDLMTDLLGTPSLDTISRVRNDKARRYLSSMRRKQPIPLSQKFPNADSLALKLLERLLAFDPKDRPTAEEALADPYFKGLAKVEREPSCYPISKMEFGFEFERQKVTKEDFRELIYREILEYHPQLLKDYVNGTERAPFVYPSAIDQLRKQFTFLEEVGGRSSPVIPLERNYVSLPRSSMVPTTTMCLKEHQTFVSNKERPVVDEALKDAMDTKHTSQNLLRASHPSQLIQAGIVVGGVAPFETGGLGSRTLTRNGTLLEQPAIPPFSYYSGMKTGNQEREQPTAERESVQSKLPHQYMPRKMGIDIAIDMQSPPFYPSQESTKNVAEDGVANFQRTRPPYSSIAAGTSGTHGKVGTVPFGLSGMC